MLLTSSQVSAAITGAIVISCTLALFVSGVILQRQSIKNLNAVLHPSGGRKGPWEKLVQKAEFALAVNDPANYELETAEDEHAEVQVDSNSDSETPSEPDWSRRAYVQMVTTADEICNAITGIASLSVQGSKPRRILIYPSAWGDNDELRIFSKELEMIGMAKRDHLLETLTTGQVAYNGGDITDSLLNQDLDQILFLEPEGLIINATRLDQIFSTDMSEETVLLGSSGDAAAMLMRPRQSRALTGANTGRVPETSGIEGVAETINSLQLSRTLDKAYSHGQLLGDVGYVHLRRAATPLVEQVDFHDELKRSEDAVGAAAAKDPLLGLVMEKYDTDRESVCGQYLWT